MNPQSHLILSPGTRVVAQVVVKGPDGKPVHPRGAMGVVVQSPGDYWHSYRVRFPDGFEAAFKRNELAIFTQYQEGDLAQRDPLVEFDLYRHIIYRCVIGSQAYGLAGDESDVDRRGIYLPPAELQWSLYGVPEQLENPQNQDTFWEAQKFLTLALKANPNVLECLYTPTVEHATDLARELIDMRHSFLSRMVYQTYNGYVMSQFKKLQADLRNKGAIKWKHVMHLLRLLISGVTVLREGVVPVRVADEHRDRLHTIRRGEVPFEELERWRLSLHREFDEAFEQTKLPDRPDYERANAWLLKGASAGSERVMEIDPRLNRTVAAQPHPLIFVTISGAHLYGFPSPDSDYDLRGVHVLPTREVVGLAPGVETIEISEDRDGLELDLVTHDAKKFFLLMLKKNGYVLEQLYSPLIVHSTPEHEELKSIGKACITRHHAHHYFGFAETQWNLFHKEHPRRVKPLLYVYRVLLTGIHLMRSGEVEANLVRLNESFRLAHINDLVQRKLAGPELSTLPDTDMTFYEREYDRLRAELQTAFENSTLPELPSAQPALNDLLLHLRLGSSLK